MGIAVVDAVRLARANHERSEAVVARRCALAAEESALRVTRAAALMLLERVDRALSARARAGVLAEPTGRALRVSGPSEVRPRGAGLSAAGSLVAVAGGAVAGSTAGALTVSTVGAAATASTGAAISGLSGAAASSATLAWLGGGTLAAGGGGVAVGATVLTGIVAAPVVVSLAAVLEWQGRRARRAQRDTAHRVVQSEHELRTTEGQILPLLHRSARVRATVDDLVAELERLLPRAEAAGDHVPIAPRSSGPAGGSDDLTTCVRSLAATAVALLAAPLGGEDGGPSSVSDDLAREARRRLLAAAAF